MWLEIILVILGLILALYLYITKSFGKWKKLGVPYVKGTFPFGSFNFLSGKHQDIQSEEFHEEFKNEKYFGVFFFGQPFLNINDPDILKQIQVKDFDHFVDRISKETNMKLFRGGDLDKIWLRQLTSLSGDDWKDVRGAFTPIFTSGKMKTMLKFIQHVSKDLVNALGEHAEAKEEFELKELFGKFSIDGLASAAFGIDAQSFTNKDSIFVKHAARINRTETYEQIILTLRMIPGVSNLMEFFKMNNIYPTETKFFRDVILQSIKHRRQTGERKNDLIDLMLDAIKEEHQDQEDGEEEQYEKDMKLNHKRKKEIDEFDIVATALVLLIAGYDTTGMALSYMAYELGNHPDIQSRLQEEIDEAFENAGGNFPDYNVIQSLPYLDMVLHETLRYHPPVGINFRAAEKDWRVPDSNIVLKKGDAIMYNARFLHRRPEYWSHPDEFYPEHFSKEEKSSRNPYAFQTFGQGPRACIGMRFSLLESKVAMMSVLREYSFKPGTKTKTPFDYDPENQLAWPKGGLWVNIEVRKDV